MAKIKCKICGDIIESTFRHDFKECKCGACFVDGGNDYFRCGGKASDIIVIRDDGTEVDMKELYP